MRDCLAAQIAALGHDIAATMRRIVQGDRIEQALRSMPGIGPVTAAALTALMPELGTIGRRQAAALAGLAPHPNQSGVSDAYRRTRGGRPELKNILFMPAMTAARHDPVMRETYAGRKWKQAQHRRHRHTGQRCNQLS